MSVRMSCWRLLLVSLMVTGWTLATPSAPAASAVLVDDFDDNAIDFRLWRHFQQGSGPEASETNQRLEITLPAHSTDESLAVAIFDAGYESVCRLSGDFDIQVDYALPVWPPRNGVRVGLLAGAIGAVERSSGGVREGFGEAYITDFAESRAVFLHTGDLTGKLRMVRTGNTVKGFFFNSSAETWMQILNPIAPTSLSSTADTGFMLLAWSHEFSAFGGQDVKVAFDNFVINHGQLTCAANAGPDQTVDEGAMVSLDGSNRGTATFLWEQVSGPAVELSGPTSATPTFKAPFLEGGLGSQVLTFQLTVTSGAQSSTDTVDVTVRNINHAPEAHAGVPQTVKELSPVTLDGTASFDRDGDQITYAWSQIAGAPVTLNRADSARPDFQAPDLLGGVTGSAVLEFKLTVSDGTCASCPSDTVTVTVEQVNHAPIANAGTDQTTNEADVVTLDATASADPDGDPIVRYMWEQKSGPVVTLSDPSSPTPTFRAPETGPGGATLVFSLGVGDGQLESLAAQVTVNVLNDNDPPRCDLAMASPRQLWPPDHKLIRVDVVGVTDPDTRNAVSITVTGVTQDEPVNGLGDGDTSPDAVLQGDHVLLRAERAGTEDGRVYHVHFMATGQGATGGSCTGTVIVDVPKSTKALSGDGVELYSSTEP